MATAAPAKAKYTARLKDQYTSKWAKELKEELKLDNVNQVPRLEKIVINAGLGRAKDEKRILEVASNTIRKITGQQPVETIARKSIASFKLREGNKVGLKVTLRDQRMYEFADRFINIVLPRLRDFHGVSEKAFDKQGNYSIGLLAGHDAGTGRYHDQAPPAADNRDGRRLDIGAAARPAKALDVADTGRLILVIDCNH